MKGYLGETKISRQAKAEDYGASSWVTLWITMYGSISGPHHKQWLIDQCLRISLGTPVEVYLARWKNGLEETRYRLGEPSKEYLDWVGEHVDWDNGIAP